MGLRWEDGGSCRCTTLREREEEVGNFATWNFGQTGGYMSGSGREWATLVPFDQSVIGRLRQPERRK
jgi:hypothetical protein